MWPHLQTRIDIIYIALLISMNNIKKITGFSFVTGIFLIALAFSILLIATTPRDVMAQNLTTNESNAVENMTATANQTGTELEKNVSSLVGYATKSANQTMPSNNSGNLGGNTSLIGSAQQLSTVLGNNSEILANNTSIGNSNMSMGEKMSAESNATRNQTGNISGTMTNVTQSANSTMASVGKNLTDAGGSLLNKTGEVAKKIIGGAADVIGNITGEIKQGVGAK
jgi:hypothetical protein